MAHKHAPAVAEMRGQFFDQVHGAVLAAGMFGVDIALGRPPKEEIPVVVAAPTDPTDIDTDGIRVPVDDRTEVWSVLPGAAGATDQPSRGHSA